jgi:lactate dehydrogenase-like 2-hydroxyacid dehydrogenase
MKRGVIIVNIGSDQLFVEADLLASLRSGQIGAAAFDCYEFSNSFTGNHLIGIKSIPLFSATVSALPNVICTPKISWFSDTSNKELRETAAREARRVIAAKFPDDLQYCVNKDALAQPFIANPPQLPFLGPIRPPAGLFQSTNLSLNGL